MKRNMKALGLGLMTASALTLAMVGVASAREGGPRMGGMAGPMHGAQVTFAELDANGDGQITTDDLTARAEARFAEADTDGDGTVTLAELVDAGIARFEDGYAGRVAAAAPGEVPGRPSDAQVRAGAEKMAARMIQRLDADKNGSVEATEMQGAGGFDRLLARADTDGDGAVSEAEFDAAKAEMGKRMERRGQGRDMRDGDDRRGGHDGERRGDGGFGHKSGPQDGPRQQGGARNAPQQ